MTAICFILGAGGLNFIKINKMVTQDELNQFKIDVLEKLRDDRCIDIEEKEQQYIYNKCHL
jgi:hypothetical protein